MCRSINHHGFALSSLSVHLSYPSAMWRIGAHHKSTVHLSAVLRVGFDITLTFNNPFYALAEAVIPFQERFVSGPLDLYIVFAARDIARAIPSAYH